ncbi:phage tail spike protein [Ammoniphilus resinae]|uniref:Phage minor structural protein n=1 Tax=Ammoniphilus resinae TaxID=861532 RepID=A0ABS4GRN3_9BACL|nr:phage tail spike protein [Ammoniphilus resinae]MBP1932945.1 phage minor structural protein [Ammoniphilus resinae]
MLGYIDLDKQITKPELFLCKPNRAIIAKLTDAFDIRQTVKLGSINELSFSLDYEIEINNQIKRNPSVDLIRERYLIKFVFGEYVEWYIIRKPSDNMEEDSDYKRVNCFSLCYELADKKIHNYNVESKTATQVLSEALNSTIWNINYVDADFDLKLRSFNISSSSVLEFIFDIAETFQALPIFDTQNRRISLYKSENIGQNRGLKISYGHYLKTINREIDTDEICTRLKVFGRDGLTISKLNPTGTSYLENFAFFLYPFQRDENYNVIQSSDYMSDSLAHALLDYEELVESKRSEFENLVSQYDSLEATLETKENELVQLNDELNKIEDQLSTANATEQPTSSLISQKNTKLDEINLKQSEIDNVKTEIDNVVNQISTIRNAISIENNFTPEQIIERNQFIVEQEFLDNNCTAEEELYKAALKRFDEVRVPRTIINLDIINLLEMVTEQYNHDKINLADIVTIKHEKLNINVEAKIVQIKYDFEEGNISLTIANVQDILSDEERFLRDLFKTISTSSSVNMDKFKWDKAEGNTSKINELINGIWNANKRTIQGGVNESVEISRKGITITDSQDPNNMVIMQHGIIAISNDGSNTWKNALTSRGLVGERVFGKILAGVNLIIDASDNENNKTFTVDSTGVKIRGTSLTIEGGLPEDQLDPTFKNSLVELNKNYSNGIRIDTTDGIVVNRSDNKVKTTMNATEGFKIQYNPDGANWLDRFLVNNEGKLVAEELQANKIVIKNDGDVLIDAMSKTIDFSKFNTILGKLQASNIEIKGTTVKNGTNTTFAVDSDGNVTVAGNISMTGGSISWGNVSAPDYTQIQGSKPPSNADNTNNQLVGKGFTTIGSNYVYTGEIKANQITAGDFTAINSIKLGSMSNPDKEITLYSSGGAVSKISSISNGSFPALYLSASEVFLGDQVYVGNPFGSYSRVLTEGDSVVAKFG